MGMTDKQFNSYVCFILSALKNMMAEKDEEKRRPRRGNSLIISRPR